MRRGSDFMYCTASQKNTDYYHRDAEKQCARRYLPVFPYHFSRRFVLTAYRLFKYFIPVHKVHSYRINSNVAQSRRKNGISGKRSFISSVILPAVTSESS